MALAITGAVALAGLEGRPVRVECSTGSGLPQLRLVGLPDTAVREAGDRVRAAIQRSDLAWPSGRVVVNLAPAALPKTGAGFDLPIALAVLGATDQVPLDALSGVYAHGELGLDGRTRPVPGVLPVAVAARRAGCDRLVVPDRAAVEADLVDDLRVIPVVDLREAVAVLRGDRPARPPGEPAPMAAEPVPDLLDVRGQPVARRAVVLAAAGGHHLLLAGPPGCGKSMLARRLPGILPPLTVDQALEVAAVHSVAGVRPPDAPLCLRPPFRDPHHTASVAGLIGGGSGIARPGEVSLAHLGVLFLDELLEVPRWVLDALRQPLEHATITIVRSRAIVRYPAKVLLVAATNPCPCGHLGDRIRPCRCRPDQVDRYRSRLSGPLLDRIDLAVEVRPVDRDRLLGPPDGEPSAVVAAEVARARARAEERWGAGRLTRDASAAAVRATSQRQALTALGRAVDALGLTARGFDRCLRVARTIADLDGADLIDVAHVEEAVAYRLAPVA
ncbi:MAG: YifB family Mg chelatase-like AAA ATPase [Actinomycetota bacterium]|nr:YifB family Mg chelatase-like AAA ATPase [Actinomycetota bacterium]